MKKKNTMPEKDWQQTHEKIRWRELRKRILVMGLTVAMVANTVDLSALSVSAKTDESETGKTTIVSFEELSKDITEQTLPIGALESDIKFPTSLTVTVEKTTQADEKEADDEEDASDKSGASDNGNADTKDSDTSKDSGNSDKSNNPNGSSSSDTEDTQARADLPSAFGALIGQMADALLPHKLIVHAAEKDDASDTASTSDGADNAKETDTASTSDDADNAKKTDTASTSDNADSVKTTGSSDAAASSETETTTEKIRLENIKWELNVEESDAEEFDSSEASNGFCYAYTPVLPDEDGDGNQLVLGKDVELPTIYVLVGEYGIALLAGSDTVQITEMDADGAIRQSYTAQDLATWINDKKSAGLQKVSIKLLNNDTSITKELTIDTDLAKEIELDLDGHTLTLAAGARLYFIKSVNITITSSDSNKGTITGSCNYRNKVKGEGLVTADRDSMLTIKHVTIENAGTGPTVAMWGGVTCTIDNASISGSSGDQVGIITIVKGKACTITNTKVTGNVWSDYGTIMFTDSCSDCTIGNGAVIENKNSGGRCVAFGSYVKKGSVKITIKKGATLTANDGNGIIMNTSYGTVAVNIEGGTFNGRLRLPDNSQIAGGTFAPASDNAIWVNNSKKTLQDLLKVGYTLQYDDDGTYADLTARWTDEGRKVMAVKSPLYFMTHPTISSGAETVMENYTAAEAPELTVKAVSGSGSISYQWYADETINGTTTKVEQTGQGAKTATYRIPTGLSAGTYQYYCVATCGNDTATSKKAAFTVEEGVAEVTVGGNTTRYATLTKAIAAIKDAVAATDADLEITLKILKNISESGSEWKIDGNTKKVSFRMDLNGCTVIGNGLYITGEGVEAVFKDTSTGQNGTLNAPISIQSKAKLTVENGNYTKNLNFSGGATGELEGGHYSQSIYIGNTNSDNTGISCTITGGTYDGREVRVCGGAALSVSGADTKIETLQIDHSKNLRAEVTLSGGEYKIITLGAFFGSDDDLLDKEQRYAIEDTLAEGYAFYSSGIKTDISRTEKTLNNVKVLSADTPEDASLAVVKFQIEKNDGGTKTKYFLTWDAAMSSLEATESNLNNRQEYATWKKLEILLLKDAEATRGHVLADKKYLPAEITLRSEGDAPHSLTGKVNYLFKTGEQDVTIENINVVGNISFHGTQTQDAAVLRLGEGVTGLRDVAVTGKAEIVIEKGAEIPDTFTGDESNLNASIYCNHDSAGDIASRIEQGASAFKVWFPIELGGITLPTDKENDTNVTQRDGATYGLYSNGGTTDQKIKVTGEVCSYEPYGGKAVTIDTTDLSFTMPSSKVTLKAHTKDDYGYCSNCKRTDLAEAYKKSRLIIEGLEGRIYDGYPQVMTGITLKTANGDVKLTGPEYKSGKELAQDSTDPNNADITNADYTVVYKNNIKYNASKWSENAPTATITGRGAYYGTVDFKFAIEMGEMQAAGAKATATEYDGKAHTALTDSDDISVTLKADKYDANAHIPVTDGCIAPCTGKTLAEDGFDSEHADKFPLKISCKSADGKWYDNANEYTVTNAGSYSFEVQMWAGNNSCQRLDIPLTAKITPRDLSKLSIPSTPLSGCAYYTGKPYSFDDLDWEAADLKKILTDSGVTGADGGSYVLVKDTDFTVTEEDTTGPTTDAKPAKLNLTGKGNYTGNAAIRFEIPYAFKLAQTPVSGTDKWYRADVPVSFAIDDQNDAAQILYRSSKAAASDSCLNGSVEIYESLKAAVAGENPGYTFTQEGKNTVTLYGKDTAKGCLSEPVEVTICIDKSAPTWADMDGVADGYGIQIKENWFRSLLNTISFGYLYNDATLDIKIQANDKKADVAEVSGISKYYYYVEKVSDTALASVKTKDELDTLAADGKFTQVDAGNWLSDSATIHGALGEDGSYVVYAYAVDGAGNQSDYICTDGIVVDAQAPVVKIADPKKEDGTLKDTEAILKVNLSEDATLMWFFVSEGVFDGVTDYTYDDCKRDIESYMKGEPKYPQFAVENDGKWAPRNGWYFKPDENLYCGQWEVRTEGPKESNANQNFVASWTPTIFKTTGTKGDNKIEIGNFGKPDVYFPLYPSKKTAVWIAAIDKAGNITALTEPAIEFTTTKTTPYVKTAPVLSGTYGNTVSAMFEKADMTKAVVTAGRNSDTKIEGTWTLASEDADEIPTVGTSEKYTLTFTPTGSDADTYDPVTCEVTPEVSKKPVTIVIADKEKFYGETNPALTWSLASGDAYLDNVLVADDTEEALGISLSTTAKGNSDVGTYAITGNSDSANYEVSFTGSGSDGKSGILTVKQAANSFTTELSCSDYTYAKDKTPKPTATAKFGTVTYKYATAALDGTAYKAPSDASAYTDAIPVNAGIYAVKAYVAETDNYTGLTSDPVVFTINKAASPNIGDEEKSYTYAAGSDDKAISVDIAGKLPTDRGTTAYALTNTYNEQLLSDVAVDQDGKLTYKVKEADESQVGATATITVTASMLNYEDAVYTMTIRITDKKLVTLKSGNKVSVNGSNALTYGDRLSKLGFSDVTFVDADTNTEVKGTLEWADPDCIPTAGTTQAGWVFKPDDSKYYEDLTGTAAITVTKATPAVVTVPTVAERVYNPAVALADSDMTGGSVTGADGNSLAGTWSFIGTIIIPTVNNKGYQAVFTPDDTNNYNTATRTITVKVTKATPVIAEKPTAGALTYGQKLSDSTLTGGKAAYQTADGTEITGAFAWKNSSIKPTAADSQKTEYDVTFTPSDKDNYNAVDTKLTLTVNKAALAALSGESRSYIYAEGSNDKAETTDVAGKLPADRGNTTFTLATEDADGLLSDVTVDTAGKLSYKVKQLTADKAGKSAAIKVTASMENYEDAVYTMTIRITDKKLVTLKSGNKVSVNGSNALTYGDKLSKLKFIDVTFVDADTNTEVKGTLEWAEPDFMPTAGTTQAGWVFKPADSKHYEELTGTAAITVARATPAVVTVPTVAERVYNPAVALADSDMTGGSVTGADGNELAGTWSFTGTIIIPTVNNKGYQAVFTPADTDNYSTATRTITVIVTKATPVIAEKPTAGALTYGQELSDSTLTGGKAVYQTADGTEITGAFAWKNSSIKPTAADSQKTEYDVTFTPSDKDNYNAVDTKLTLTVNKAALAALSGESRSYIYAEGSNDKAETTDVAGKLPADRGNTTFTLATEDADGLLSDVTVDTAGKLSYKVKQLTAEKAGKSAAIKVTASMENYEDAVYTMTIRITDKKLVALKSGNTVSVNGSNALTYGDRLSKLGFSDVTFVDADTDTKVEGTLEWADPDCMPTAGTTQAGWVFKPADSKHYEELTGTAAITVAKATPAVVTVPTVAEREYNPVVALADSDMTGGSVTGADGNSLAGTWSFTGTIIIPTVNNKGYQAVFTPADTDNYSTATRTITVIVTKATPVIAEKPTAGALTYGQELSDSTLTGGKAVYQTADGTEITGAFAWKNSSIKPTAADSQKTEYDVTFTPSDKDNYNAVDTKLVLTVNKAAQAPNMPQAAMAPAHSTKKVGDITLPDGWSWQEADKDTALADGVAVTATAVYTGADKGNYETESVSITITRSECEHKNTEIINKKDATCSVEGYTGDTYCKDCGETLATGTAIEKKPHTVKTSATCISKAVCSVCGEAFGEVDANNHVHTTVKNRKEATCTQTGYTGDTYCTDCNKLLGMGKELAALGHDYKATVTKQPTTTEEGIRTYTCTRCNSSYTESIAKLPEEQHTHNYTGSITKEATCTDAGVRTYTCSCGDSYTENIPATGHSYVSKVTKAATTTEEGIMTYTCSKCGHSYTQPIAKIKSDDSSKDNGSQNQKPQTGTDNGNQNQKPQPDTDNGKDNGTSIKPYIKDDSGKEGWDVIKPQLEEAKSGDTVTVAMNGTTVVPKDVIDSIKGKDTTLVLDMENGLSWKIFGKDITDAAGDIDFGVTVGADAGKSIPVDVINNVTGERYSMNLTLAYDGEFGFTATLTVNMESKNAGLYANLFYYNEQTGELEFISAGQIDPDGNVELVFTHASDYTIVVDAKIMSDNGQADNKSDETIPASKTDDSTSKYAWNNTIIIIIGICIILIVFGAVFYVRKKSGSEEE